MIAYLEGTLHETVSDFIVLLVGGVGYQVYLSKITLQNLPAPGSNLRLHIHTVVREDSLTLYGFQYAMERELFLKLIQVSGVGPKMALTILSGLAPGDFAEAVSREDLVRITAIPGVGKKTAERLIMELKDKIFGLYPRASGSGEDAALPKGAWADEAISALTNLGYTRQEALGALKAIPKAHEMPLEVLVREGLKALSG